MSAPDPVPKSSWLVPTSANSTAVMVGGYLGQLITVAWQTYVSHHDLSVATVCSITGLCIFVINHCFPDGGRR